MVIKRLTNNRLLLVGTAVLAFYWAIATVTPNPYVSSAASFVLLVAGFFTFLRYIPTAYEIIFKGVRSTEEGGEGSHYAILGITLLACGSSYIGMFGLLWVWFGQPSEWVGTATSGFGRALMGLGFSLMFISPGVSRPLGKASTLFWIITAVIVALLAGFMAGSRFFFLVD